MTLQTFLDYINFITNKDPIGETLTPEQYNTLLPYVNYKYYKRLYGLPDDYQVSAPFSKVAWELTQNVTDSLSTFKVLRDYKNNPLMLDSNGRANYPSDYFHVSSMRYKKLTNANCGVDERWSDIEIVFDNQLGGRLSNSITNPTKDNPICCFYNTYIQFYPTDIQSVEFTYLRKPATPIYDYYIDTTTEEQIYLAPGETSPSTGADPANHLSTSVEFEWTDSDIVDLAQIMLKELGINLRSEELQTFALMQQQQGA